MVWLVLFLIELVGLFFLSQQATKALSSFLLRFFKSQKTTIYIISALFFPGVFLHEMAHLLVANILFVRTGEIEFFPQIQDDRVKLGSVAIAKTDPLRRFIIGVAPVLVGIVIMLALFLYFSSFFPNFNWQTALLIYGFFEIGNTMFSSKKDMEGSLALLVALAVLFLSLFIIGFRVHITFPGFLTNQVQFFLMQAVFLLLIPLVVDALLVGILRGFRRRIH